MPEEGVSQMIPDMPSQQKVSNLSNPVPSGPPPPMASTLREEMMLDEPSFFKSVFYGLGMYVIYGITLGSIMLIGAIAEAIGNEVSLYSSFYLISVATLSLGWGIGQESLWPNSAVVLGGIVIGPLLGGYTFLLNDWADIPLDKGHRRKLISLHWLGLIKGNTLLYTAGVFLSVGLALSFFLSIKFGILCSLIAALSALYSLPGPKWKARGGFDLFTNMVGIGILCPLGGWVLADRELTTFPVWYLASLTAIIGALYAPTTVADHDIDLEGGLRTLAIRLGPQRTIILAQVLMLFGYGSLIIEAMFDYVMTREILIRIWPYLIMQPIIYIVYLNKPTYQRLLTVFITTSFVSGIGSVFFLAYLSGVLSV